MIRLALPRRWRLDVRSALHSINGASNVDAVPGDGVMTLDDEAELRGVHERVRIRWSRIDWGFEEFRRHVGDERPPHLEDLYLGGAAGHRRSGSWECVHEEVATSLEVRLRRQPCGTFAPEDLVSESITVLMEDDDRADAAAEGRRPAKIVRYRGRTSLLNYFLVVAKRIAIGSHRRRREHAAEIETFDPPDRGGIRPEVDPTADDLDRLHASIRRAYLGLTARQRFLLAMIHGQGMPKAQAGELVGLPPWGVSRELDKIHDRMREALTSVMPTGWTGPSREVWESAWRRCWSEQLETEQVTQTAPRGGRT
ncbi:MAG: sigma-70 family RNA polymerase sigma factor [Deltaproteobacteria bacterium]|nr:sigma-70 family RNA polymerase sigma factor [Deltaproteobacteria bacterium]